MTNLETVFIGLGGNVGDVVSTMSGALSRLDSHKNVCVRNVSPVYRTPPWGNEDQDWFHNACACLTTKLQPLELLEVCLETERHFKRERRVRWGPRTLDLDILIFGDQRNEGEKLTIPHPRITERGFVLKPLLDIAPELTLEGKSLQHWLKKLEEEELESLPLAENWWQQSNS